MNRYLLDINVLIDFLIDDDFSSVRSASSEAKEQVLATKRELFELLKDDQNVCVIVSSSLVTLFFALTNKQKHLRSKASKLLLDLYRDSDIWQIVADDHKSIKEALEFCEQNGADFEDVLLYFCAKNNDCRAIITNDKNFPQIDIPLIRTHKR